MKPILFNTAMVRAILDGRKTVTRRLIKNAPENVYPGKCLLGAGLFDRETGLRVVSPQYKPGEILYARETWAKNVYGTGSPYFYKASPETYEYDPDRWYPSIHMPKEAARIFLRVTNVYVERLQDITADEIRAEGLTSMCAMVGDMEIASQEWRNLWDSTIKKADMPLYGWDANPWVWVIEFERTSEFK